MSNIEEQKPENKAIDKVELPAHVIKWVSALGHGVGLIAGAAMSIIAVRDAFVDPNGINIVPLAIAAGVFLTIAIRGKSEQIP